MSATPPRDPAAAAAGDAAAASAAPAAPAAPTAPAPPSAPPPALASPPSAPRPTSHGGRTRVRRGVVSRGPYEAGAANLGRLALIAALLVAVFWTGGSDQEALALCLGLGAVAWITALSFRQVAPAPNPIAWVWWGLGLVTLWTVVPLPRALVGLLHPAALPISDGSRAALGLEPAALLTLSIAPAESAMQAALALGAASMALTGGMLLSDHRGRRMAMVTVRWLVVAPLVVGVLWQLAWAPWFTRFVPPEMREQLRVLSLVNANHVAALLIMSFGLSFGAIVSDTGNLVRLPAQLAAAMAAGLLALTPSRSALVGLGLTVAFSLTRRPKVRAQLRVDRDKLDARARANRILQLLTLVGALAIIGLPALEQEFGALFLVGRRDAKLVGFEAAARYVLDAPLLGQGFGSLPIKTLMQAGGVDVRLEYAENFVLDALIAHGLPATLLALAALVVIVGKPFRLWPRVGPHVGPAIAVAAVLVHDLVDFSLQLPGVLLPFLAVGTVLDQLRPSPWHGERGSYWTSRASLVVASGIGLVVAGALLIGAWDGRLRDVTGQMQGLGAEVAAHVVAERFPQSHHAFYRLGRARLDEGDLKGAMAALDRAIELRPGSLHARYYRMAVALRLGRSASEDAAALLDAEGDLNFRTVELLLASDAGARAAIDAAVQRPSRAWNIGLIARTERPATLIDLANELRAKHQGKRFSVEYLVARELAKAGDLDQARRIGAGLLGDPTTESLGWMALATVAFSEGKHRRAFTLYADLCVSSKGEEREACMSALAIAWKLPDPATRVRDVRALFPYVRANRATMHAYWVALAEALLAAGDPESAQTAARRALGYDEKSAAARKALAYAALRSGNMRGAETAMEDLRARGATEMQLADLAAEVSATRGPLGMRGRPPPLALPPVESKANRPR